MNIGQLAMRGVVGPLFVGHGTQKLFGWFDGHGLEGTGGFFEQLGLRPGKRHATAAGVTETVGGAMLTAGALTPVAAGMLSGTMVTAIRKAHGQNGPWNTSGGWEYNVVLLTALAALTDAGPGKPSVDEARFPWMKGPLFAAAQFAAGMIGSYLITERLTEPAAAPQEGAADVSADPASPRTDEERTGEGRFAPTGTPAQTATQS